METNHTRKARAVKLSADAVQLLSERLPEAWREAGNQGRLTRDQRAEFLGISVATSERILHRKGNDLAVLIEVFQKVGLPWSDSYLDINTSLTAPESPPVIPARRSVPKLVWAVSAGVVLVVLLAIVWPKPPPDRRHETAIALITRGRNAYFKADFRKAKEDGREAFRLAKALRFADLGAEAMTLEGDALSAQGKIEAALSKYREAIPLWSTFGNDHGKGALLEVIAVAEARLGQFENARAHFEESRVILRGVNKGLESPGPLQGLGSIAAVLGDVSEARRFYGEAGKALEHKPDPAMACNLKALQALLLCDDGKYDVALDELAGCLKFWEGERHLRWKATTLRQIATVHLAAGRTELAKDLLRQAIKLYEAVGDNLNRNDCTMLLQEGPAYAKTVKSRTESYF